MDYDAITDPYLDPLSGILVNRLGIIRADELEKIEANYSATAIATLVEQPLAGNFDLKHLQNIHQHLLGLVYSWAGELRTVEISKGTTRFASAEHLQLAAEEIFNKLTAEKLLSGLDDTVYAARLGLPIIILRLMFYIRFVKVTVVPNERFLPCWACAQDDVSPGRVWILLRISRQVLKPITAMKPV